MVDGHRSDDFGLTADVLDVDRGAFRDDLGPAADPVPRRLAPNR